MGTEGVGAWLANVRIWDERFTRTAARHGAAQTTFWLIVENVPGLKDWLLSQFNVGGVARL